MTLSCHSIVKRTAASTRATRARRTTLPLSCLNAVKRHKNKQRPPIAPLYADVSSVGDRSGSMQTTNGGSQHGAVAYMEKQRDQAQQTQPVLGFHVEFTTFDNRVETHFNNTANNIDADVLKNVFNSMEPRGRTRLFDTAIEAVQRQIQRIRAIKASLSPEVVRLINDSPWLITATTAVMTDGCDNESLNSGVMCKKVFKNYRKNYGGIAFFIAANQDAALKAREYGFDPKFSLQMGNNRMSAINAARATATAQGRCLSSGSSTAIPSYTDIERQQSSAVDSWTTNSIMLPPSLGRRNSIRCNLFP